MNEKKKNRGSALKEGLLSAFSFGSRDINLEMLRESNKTPYVYTMKNGEDIFLVAVDKAKQVYYDVSHQCFIPAIEFSTSGLRKLNLDVPSEEVIEYMNLFFAQYDLLDHLERKYVEYLQKVKELLKHVVVFQVQSNVMFEDVNERVCELIDNEKSRDTYLQEYLKKTDYTLLNNKMFQKGLFRSEANIREELGEKAELLEDIDYMNTHCAVNVKGGSRMIDAYDFTSKIFEYISSFPNVYIFENTKLKNINANYDYVEITTQNDFKIKASSLILTTGIDSFALSKIPNIEVYRRFSIVTNTNLNKRMCIKLLNDIPIYIRNDERGNMIVSGIDTKYIAKMENEKYIDMLKKDNARRLVSVISKLFPKTEISKEIGMYSGNIYVTKDNMPIIGEIEDIPNTYINLGVGSSSISQMLIGADILKDAIKGYYKKEMNLFKLTR